MRDFVTERLRVFRALTGPFEGAEDTSAGSPISPELDEPLLTSSLASEGFRRLAPPFLSVLEELAPSFVGPDFPRLVRRLLPEADLGPKSATLLDRFPGAVSPASSCKVFDDGTRGP